MRSLHKKVRQLVSAEATEADTTTSRLHEQLGYGYDDAGNLQYRTNNALIQTFNVNSLNELTTVTRDGTLTVAGTTTSEASSVTVNSLSATLYEDDTFAKAGFSLPDGNNTFTAVAQDSLSRQDSQSITVYLPATASYSYDDNGNLLSDGKRGFEYDDENQLIKVTVTNAWKSEFSYDGKLRRRIRKEYTWQSSAWVQTNEVRYVYDGNLVIQERDGNNLAVVSYTRGKDLSGSLEGAGGIGGLLARTDMPATLNAQPSSFPHAYYHCDGNGNVTALVATNQLLVARYLYDPYGNTLSVSGPLAEVNLYRFSSKEWHPNSGLVYYLYRFYEGSVQRWVNRDPIKELGHFVLRNRHSVQIGVREQNLFQFVRNAPIDRVDFLGLKDRGYPLDGVVCNDCFGPGAENYGTDVYVLINGEYFTLPPGKCTTSTPLSSDDVDGVWICRYGECEFWNVQPSGPTNPFNACGKKPKNCDKWNGDPKSGNSPRTRSGGKQNNSPPSPEPPIYRHRR